MELGDWNEATTTKANGGNFGLFFWLHLNQFLFQCILYCITSGSNVTWTSLDIQAEVTRNIIKKEKLKVVVVDENTTRGDSILGTGNASLRRLCAALNSEIEMRVELTNEIGAIVGNVQLNATLLPLAKENALDSIPDSAISYAEGKLRVTQINGFDLRGGDVEILGFNRPVSNRHL